MGNPLMGLAGDQVLAIAQADAARVYRELSHFRIQLVLEDDGWHVDYELKNPRLKGGGPHYIIDAQTGAVISKRYVRTDSASLTPEGLSSATASPP